ncbi:MAG: polysaccharide biosynthesis tyrosine autokinase [Anaerolineaceae bacterium]|nr:polysaccharide biosynthesis tyrosine autokinase [Anaerolineaceae bacterium]
MDIKEIFSTIKRWLWLIILGVAIGGGVGYYVAIRQTPVYQAEARFVILPPAQTTYDYYSNLNNQQLIDTYAQLLTTEELLFQASETLGFPVRKGQATAKQVDDTKFVLLTVRDTDPFKAATIANGLVEIMIAQNDKLQSVQYEVGEQNLQVRIDQAEQQIETLENQISQKSYEITQEQIASAQTEMEKTQERVNSLKLEIGAIDPESPYEEDIELLISLESQLDEQSKLLESYQKVYTELVVLGQSSGNVVNNPTDLDRLTRTLTLYQQIYITSINNLESLKLSKAQNSPTVMQVESAVKPDVPISPKPMQSTIMGLAIGLFIAAATIFLIEFLDDTLKTPDEIKAVLDVPVIGFIGDLKPNNSKNNGPLGLFVARNPRSPVSEAFRALRTNIEYSSVDKKVQAVLITSSGESEGKSTVAANLAVVEAQAGKKVVLIDTDMRRPKVHVQFNKPNRMGLTDLIAGKLSINEVLKPIEMTENLSIITCGTIPPNPAELLGSERMTEILKDLRERFDFVIIDTPPMIVSDAQILSSKVDGLIFVIIPGKTKIIAAKRPLEELERIGARVLGVIANKIPKNRDYYYGGYNYYSPYSSHYSYSKENASLAEDQEIRQEEKPLVEEVKNTKKLNSKDKDL